jgi:hypothetical protein
MSPQHVVRIDFSEIKSIEIACENCGSVVTISFPRKNLFEGVSCFACNAKIWNYEDYARTYVFTLTRNE